MNGSQVKGRGDRLIITHNDLYQSQSQLRFVGITVNNTAKEHKVKEIDNIENKQKEGSK